MPDKQRQRPGIGRDRQLTMPLIAPLFAFGDSVIDAFDPTTWAFEGSIGVNPAIAQIDIPPTRFWRFSHGNAIVLEVLLKDQEAEIIPKRRAETIVAIGKRLGFAGFVVAAAKIPRNQRVSDVRGLPRHVGNMLCDSGRDQQIRLSCDQRPS
jgi:hypothetical protein